MSADLSGPHEPSPAPAGPSGSPLEQYMAAYFLVAVFSPDAADPAAPPERAVFVDVFRNKDNTPDALKRIIAKCELLVGKVRRLHTDLGAEFCNRQVESFCLEWKIFRRGLSLARVSTVSKCCFSWGSFSVFNNISLN